MLRTPLSRAAVLRPVSLLAMATTLAAVPQIALAQDNAEDEAQPQEFGNQIIVSAQKRNELAKDVPITISAVTGKRIEELGVTDLDELSYYIPGLLIQEQSANNPGVVIRGITSDSGSAQQGPRVTLYYNGVDISRSRGSYQAIYDLERTEVIKGPQATLFGTASAVGAISQISARPKEGTSGRITAGYGNFNQTVLGGFLNGGSDVLAARLAFEWRTRDGYVENINPGQNRDLYEQDQLGLRASVRYTPTADLTVDLIGTYDRQRNGGTAFISGRFPAFAGAPGGAANAFTGRANLSGNPAGAAVLGDDELGLVRDVYDLNLTAEYTISDDWSFTTVNGYREFDSAEVFDADGSAAPFLEFSEIAKGWQVSHEGRFSYDSSNLRASAGWNLFLEDGRQNVPFATEEGTFLQCLSSLFGAPLIPGIPCVAPDGSVPAAAVTGLATGGAVQAIPYSSVFENQGRNEAYSVFADATWIPTEALELTAGVRLLQEYRQSGFFADVPNSQLSGAPLIPGQIDTGGQTFTVSDNFFAVLPRFNALYRVNDDVNVFATISKGRRSPVVQLGAARAASGNPVANVTSVGEEVVWNYEVGLKGASGPVSGSVGVYYQVYDSFQVTIPEFDDQGNPTGATRTDSAGSASNLGVEAELTVELANWLRAFGNFGYIDGGIDNNPENGIFAGAKFRLQPEWQASGGFTVDYDFGNGVRFFATPSVTHRSRIAFELPTVAQPDPITQGPITLVNARAGVSFADDRYEIAAFIRNAFDQDFLLDAGNTGGAFTIPTFIPGEPRFFGVQFTARFGD